jgi:hypothetical protein
MLASIGRQIRRGGGNRLNAGLLVTGEECHGTFRFGQRPQHLGLIRQLEPSAAVMRSLTDSSAPSTKIRDTN